VSPLRDENWGIVDLRNAIDVVISPVDQLVENVDPEAAVNAIR
jgi:hypothetical protein